MNFAIRTFKKDAQFLPCSCEVESVCFCEHSPTEHKKGRAKINLGAVLYNSYLNDGKIVRRLAHSISSRSKRPT